MYAGSGLATVKGPPTFIPCSVCGRKLSQHSMRFHEPQCLQRSKAENTISSTGNKRKTKKTKTRNLNLSVKQDAIKRNVSTVTLPRRDNSSLASVALEIFEDNNSPDLFERPRTQTLNHPTPNIVHPIIPTYPKTNSKINRDFNGVQPKKEGISESIVSKQPSSSSSSSSSINLKQVKLGNIKKSSPTSSCCGLQFPADKSELFVNHCKSCERSDRPEKLHGHSTSNDNRKVFGTSLDSSLLSSNLIGKAKVPVKIYKQFIFRDEKRSNSKLNILRRPFDRAVLVGDKGSSSNNINPVQFVSCQLCGKRCTSKSFDIHQRHCLERWEIENDPLPAMRSKVPVKTRLAQKAIPFKPGAGAAGISPWEAFQDQLVACPHCARTFLPERLRIHERTCNKKDGDTAENKDPSETTKKAVRRPPMVVCYICGRQFGTHSISLHEPHCLKKWRLENDRLPKHQRRPEPQKPETILTADQSSTPQNRQLVRVTQPSSPALLESRGSVQQSSALQPLQSRMQLRSTSQPQYVLPRNAAFDQARRNFTGARACWVFFLKRDGDIDLDAMAEAAWQSHLDQLVPCSRCGRTFLPDRLPIHQRGCHETSGMHGSKKDKRG